MQKERMQNNIWDFERKVSAAQRGGGEKFFLIILYDPVYVKYVCKQP
jgi:hypothetical protein